MGKLFGTILENAVTRKINNLRFAAGQVNEKAKSSLIEKRPYSKCSSCGCSLTSTEVYGEWDDYCIDCYSEESSDEK